jgi:hypothetical protein
VQVITPIVELLIRNKGWCLGLADLCAVLVAIGDPSAGPFLQVIASNVGASLSAHSIYDRVKDMIAEHGAAPCDNDLLARLTAVYHKTP